MLRAFGVSWWWLLLGYGEFVGGAAPGVCEWGAVTRCSLSLSTSGHQRRSLLRWVWEEKGKKARSMAGRIPL